MSSTIKQELAAGYTKTARRIETTAIVLFFVAELWLWIRLSPGLTHRPILASLAILIGYILADFVSGLVHWLGDTWGNTATPLFGKGFIRPFREHHIDQTAITRHDFIETNGSNCLATLFILIPANLLLPDTWNSISLFLYTVFASTSLGIFATNQFHKWAHWAESPHIIRWLQCKKLILSPTHHAIHHISPYDRYYCITVGWLNPLLAHIGFFRGLERCITKVTGALPRQEDLRLAQEIVLDGKS